MNLERGSIVGHYEILGPLGAGGMGEVYRARDINLKREVAIKVLPEHVANSPDSLSRFEREAVVLAQLSHPNILAIHDFGEYDGVTLAATELLEGETLRGRLGRSPLSVQRSLEIGIGISEGLSAAHSKGIVHRDLKPENIFLTNDNQVKILDFGLARMDLALPEGHDPDHSLPTETDPGMIKGTIGYMAPEQLRGQTIDARSDIFSLGCVLYEMLTGRRAFARTTVADTMTAILKEEPPDFSESGRQIPIEAEKVATHCLEKDPNKRYQSSQDLALHLRTLVHSTGLSPPLFKPRLKKSLRKWLGAVAGFTLLALMFVYWFAGGETQTPPPQVPSVAVLYFENNTGDSSLDWLRTALANMLVTDLSQSPQIEVLSTDRLYQILEELGKLDDPIVSFDVVQEVARRAKVSTVLLGSFVRAGDVFRLSTRLQEAQSGRILSTERVEGPGESAIFEMVDEITRRIKETLEVEALDPRMDLGIEAVTSSSVEAYRYYLQGNDLHFRSQEREAILRLEKAVELDPSFAMALAKLSVAHSNLGHVEEAHRYARRALEHVDRLTARERYYIEGRYYSLNTETLDRAIEAYERAISIYPDHDAARHNLALLYAHLERHNDAITHYEELRRAGESFAGTHANLAESYLAIGEVETGLEVLSRYTEAYADNASGHRDLGQYLALIGRYEEAEVALSKAQLLAPGDLGIKLSRWQIRVMEEKWDAAREVAEEIVTSTDPSWKANGLFLLANLKIFLGRSAEAQEILTQVESMFPGQHPLRAQALAGRARLELKLDRAEQALRLATQAYEAGRGYPVEEVALSLAAFANARLGHSEQALRIFEEARAKYTNLPQKLVDRKDNLMLGMIALMEGEAKEAAARFTEARSTLLPNGQGPRYDQDLYLYGFSQWEAGNRLEAVKWFRRMVERPVARILDPIGYVRSFFYLGAYHQKEGNLPEAYKYFNKFVEMWGDGDMDQVRVDQARESLS